MTETKTDWSAKGWQERGSPRIRYEPTRISDVLAVLRNITHSHGDLPVYRGDDGYNIKDAFSVRGILVCERCILRIERSVKDEIEEIVLPLRVIL